MILHLGVIDLPYSAPPGGGKRKKVAAGTQTTGDVAGWLEDKYHVMEVFYESHGAEIAEDLENSLAGAMENLLLGAPVKLSGQAFASAESKIAERFKTFLSSQEIETLGIPGVPTQAALDGVSHRFKNPRFRMARGKKVKRDPRPSFIDTGLYQSSSIVWID